MKVQTSAPSIGAIVWAFLPEEMSTAKAKARPVVVLDVEQRGELTYLTVAKCTSQHTDEVYLGEFAITDAQDLESCGLSKPTKVQLRRRETLLWSDVWFASGARRDLPKHLLRKLFNAAQEIHLI